MTKPKVTYFDFPGSRGEEVRLAMWVAGVDFDDNRISGATWSDLKPRTPFGSLPMFELEGRPPLAQVNAILVYIGREYGLHPKDNWEAAQHEALMGAVEDLRNNVVPATRIKDPEASLAARKELATNYLPQWGSYVERRLGAGPFVAGANISVADIKLYMGVKWFTSGGIDHVPADVFAPFPKLSGIAQAVAKHPRIVAWYAR
jgi:prostaglandin-H2 D-isomerase / glutathione transferase